MTTKFDTVSFLSDYGMSDEFVGVVKSVIADLAPHARVIDLVHEIAPFDVRAVDGPRANERRRLDRRRLDVREQRRRLR